MYFCFEKLLSLVLDQPDRCFFASIFYVTKRVMSISMPTLTRKIRLRMKLQHGLLAFIISLAIGLGAALPTMAQLDPLVYEQGFQVRKLKLINNMADQYATRAPGFANTGTPTDPEKYNWPSVCALFDKYGLNNDTANARIRRFANNSPFHFTLVGMARIMAQYAGAPAMVQTRATYLNKVWNRTDGYNAFTGEGTENHNNMTRTSAYLYAQYSVGNPLYPQAATKLAEMKQWILEWSKSITKGGHGEWNSSTYNTWSVAGWLNLYDYATDNDVKLCARSVLDYYAIEQALSYNQGITAGAEMRGNALSSVGSDTDFLNWLWFDESPRTVGIIFFTSRSNNRISSVYAAVSSYRPPLLAVELARKSLATKAMYKIGYPDYLILNQGHSPAHFYIDNNFTLSSACIKYGGFTGGDYQINSFKLVGRVSNGDSLASAQVLTGCGRYYAVGGGKARQPYDQYVQHNNVVMQLTQTPTTDATIYSALNPVVSTWRTDWQRDFSARFPGDGKPNPVGINGTTVQNIYRNANYISWPRAGVQVLRRNKVLFLSLEKVFVAIRTIGLDSGAIRAELSGRNMVVDSAAYGSLCGLVIEARNNNEFTSFANFQDSILIKTSLNKAQANAGIVTYRNLKGESIEATYNATGQFDEPVYDWGYGVTSPSINQNLAAWRVPTWPNALYNGRIPSWKVNNVPVNLSNYRGIDGPNVVAKDNNVRLQAGNRYYNIDYTGSLPVFSDGPVGLGQSVGAGQEPVLYPNPSKGTLQLMLYTTQACTLSVSLWTSNGKVAKQFTPVNLGEAGSHTPSFSLSEVPSGTYFCQIVAGNNRWTKQLVVVK